MTAAEPRVDTASVLFTDIVGSTALRARLGEEAADEIRLIHDRLIREAIEAKRGTVVKHTGDGAMATFSAAVDAVAAAVAIQQALDAHSRRGANERIEVRIGISVGDVTFDGDDCFGLPVIEAQRLEAAAEGGQILCAEVVRHLARGRGGHEFASMGELELKGIPDPVPAVEVRWEPAPQVAMPREMPLPSTLAYEGTFGLAGRARELGALVDAWKDAANGRRRVVLLSGEPGIGKTRLAIETALVARRENGLVLAGRCDEDLDIPFQPFAEALRGQLALADLPAAALGALAGELARLVPELPGRVPGLAAPLRSDPEAERAQLFEAVTEWLRATAAAVPVMLVLDDLHWADRPTLMLLRHLVHESAHDALLVIGTYRSTDLDRSHPLAGMLADFRREPGVERLALDGLGVDDVAQFLERAAGHALDERALALADAVFAETAGNPFFVGEIVRHLVESEAIVFRDGRWTSDLTLETVGLPEGVREVVGRRISRLDADAQRLLSLAAVIGHEFSVPVLASVAGMADDDALDGLDAARAAGLVTEVGVDRYRFGHALVRATLIGELTTTRRVRTHRKIADAIEARHAGDLDPVVTELAYHYGEAAAAGADRAVEYARRAGELAYAASALDDAVRWYTLALDHLDTDHDTGALGIELRIRLGTIGWMAGDANARSTLRDAARRAREAGLTELMAEALLVSERSSFESNEPPDPEKIELFEELLPRLGDRPALRARVLGALAIELIFVGDLTRREPLLDEATAIARSRGDPLTTVDVYTSAFMARPRSRRTTERFLEDRQFTEEAIAAAERLGDPGWHIRTLAYAAYFWMVLGDGAEMRATVAHLDRIVTETQHPYAWRQAVVLLAQVAAIDGRLAEANALSKEQLESWIAAGIPGATTYYATARLVDRRERGRLAELIEPWTAFVEARPGSQGGPAAAVVAFALAETGNLDAAARRLDAAKSGGFRDLPDDAGWPLAMAMWSETAALVVDREAAEALHRLQVPLDGLQNATGGINGGPISRLLARLELVLDLPDDAERHFEQAVEQSERFGSPVWVARCALDWAEHLLARGDHDSARSRLARADAAIGELVLPALRAQSARLHAGLDG